MLNNSDNSIRARAASLFTNRFFIFEAIILSSFLIIWMGGAGFLPGILIAFLTLWALGWDWSFFGLKKVKWISSLIISLGYTLIIILSVDLFIEPMVQKIAKQPIDLEAFDGMRGNLKNLVLMLIIMWVVAAFGEEFFYRGYMMKRLAILFGNSRISWLTAALISSLVFGLAHAYQGLSGMITTGMVGLILAIAFLRNRNNLLIGILAHGIYDTYGLILIYLEKEDLIRNMVFQFFH